MRVIVIVSLIIAVLYPFETQVVPAWRLRVVDERGAPYGGMEVSQSWKHYTLELADGQHGEFRVTDGDGYVSFPERTMRANLIWRVVVPMINGVLTLMHGSLGVRAYVLASSLGGQKAVYYAPGKPLPEQLVLPRGDGNPDE